MAVKYVAGHMDKYPDTIGADTVDTLDRPSSGPPWFENRNIRIFCLMRLPKP